MCARKKLFANYFLQFLRKFSEFIPINGKVKFLEMAKKIFKDAM